MGCRRSFRCMQPGAPGPRKERSWGPLQEVTRQLPEADRLPYPGLEPGRVPEVAIDLDSPALSRRPDLDAVLESRAFQDLFDGDHLLFSHGHTSIRSMMPRCSYVLPEELTFQSPPRLITWVSSQAGLITPRCAPNRARHPGRVRAPPLAIVIFMPSPPVRAAGQSARRWRSAALPRHGRPPSHIFLPDSGSLPQCHPPGCGGPGPLTP